MPKGVYDHSGQKHGPNITNARFFIKPPKDSSPEQRAVIAQTKMAEESLEANRCPNCSLQLTNGSCSCGFKFVHLPYSGPDVEKGRQEFYRRVSER